MLSLDPIFAFSTFQSVPNFGLIVTKDLCSNEPGVVFTFKVFWKNAYMEECVCRNTASPMLSWVLPADSGGFWLYPSAALVRVWPIILLFLHSVSGQVSLPVRGWHWLRFVHPFSVKLCQNRKCQTRVRPSNSSNALLKYIFISLIGINWRGSEGHHRGIHKRQSLYLICWQWSCWLWRRSWW